MNFSILSKFKRFVRQFKSSRVKLKYLATIKHHAPPQDLTGERIFSYLCLCALVDEVLLMFIITLRRIEGNQRKFKKLWPQISTFVLFGREEVENVSLFRVFRLVLGVGTHLMHSFLPKYPYQNSSWFSLSTNNLRSFRLIMRLVVTYSVK